MNTSEAFEPGLPAASMCDSGTRVAVFQEDGVWVAHGVDIMVCAHGETLKDTAENWLALGAAYKEHTRTWEPPRPTEYASVWEAGAPMDFAHGIKARTVNAHDWHSANSTYNQKYARVVHGREPQSNP